MEMSRPRVGRTRPTPTRFYRLPLVRDVSHFKVQAFEQGTPHGEVQKHSAVNHCFSIGSEGESYGSAKPTVEDDPVLFM